jgi:ribosome-associated protein
MNLIDFELRGEFIPLDALLKATAVAHSGGAAKTMVADGAVQVDGQPESRKTCKIRPGQVVTVGAAHTRIRVHGPAL